MAQLRAQAELGRKYLRELRREVMRLAMLADDSMDGGALAKAAEHLEEPELLELKRVYEAQAARRFPPSPSCGAGERPNRGRDGISGLRGG